MSGTLGIVTLNAVWIIERYGNLDRETKILKLMNQFMSKIKLMHILLLHRLSLNLFLSTHFFAVVFAIQIDKK